MKPTHSGTNEPLEAVIQTLHKTQGLDVSPYDESFLLKSIDKRLAATGLTSVAAYRDCLADNPAEAETFWRSLRIGYSEFFRNPLAFSMLGQWVLPHLAEEKKKTGRGEIRVWSAGCAAGQEAWSVAMLLNDLAEAHDPPLAYRIFATDLSEHDLALAHAGIYNADALGNVLSRYVRDYFVRQGDSFAIVPRLRTQVDFSVYDLLDERSSSPGASIYGDFDLILCCNLLFYYRPEIRRHILNKVCRALAPGGYVVTGETERDIVAEQHGLRAVGPPAAIFQKQRVDHA